MQFDNPPIFLVGAERSGTTLLRLMLAHHPKISFLSESEYIVDFMTDDGQFPDVKDYCSQLEKARFFPRGKVVLDDTLSIPELASSILLQRKQKPESPFIGAKVYRNFDRLRKLWPESKFIHIIRDPRDVSDSRIKMGWDHTHWHAAREWMCTEKLWSKLSSTLSESDYIEIYYEELIRNPEKTLKRICDWIGVEYDPAMFDYAETSTYSVPDPKHIQSWRRKLSDLQIQQVEAVCHELLQKRNYELSGLPIKEFSSSEKLLMAIKNKYKKVRFRVNRYGLMLYIQSVIAKRIPHEGIQQSVREKLWDVDQKHLK